jgi:hypothetical protein
MAAMTTIADVHVRLNKHRVWYRCQTCRGLIGWYEQIKICYAPSTGGLSSCMGVCDPSPNQATIEAAYLIGGYDAALVAANGTS